MYVYLCTCIKYLQKINVSFLSTQLKITLPFVGLKYAQEVLTKKQGWTLFKYNKVCFVLEMQTRNTAMMEDMVADAMLMLVEKVLVGGVLDLSILFFSF